MHGFEAFEVKAGDCCTKDMAMFRTEVDLSPKKQAKTEQCSTQNTRKQHGVLL